MLHCASLLSPYFVLTHQSTSSTTYYIADIPRLRNGWDHVWHVRISRKIGESSFDHCHLKGRLVWLTGKLSSFRLGAFWRLLLPLKLNS